MCKFSDRAGFTGGAGGRQMRAGVKGLSGLLVLALLFGLCPVQADDEDETYLQIYSLIQQADDLNASGKAGPAKAKYQEAQTALRDFKKNYPHWNVKLVSYRLNDVTRKLAALSGNAAAPARSDTSDTVSNAPASPPAPKAATSTSAQPVKLLEAGAEPRQVLRLHPNPGDKQTLSMTLTMAPEVKMGEVQSQAMKLPAITLTVEVTIKEVSDNGEISYEMVMSDTSVADEAGGTPQVGEFIKSALAGVKGMSAMGKASTRGLSKGLEFKVPGSADAQTRQVMDQMKDALSQVSTPLPEEAVGLGAKWEVQMPLKSQGMTIQQTVTYELASVEGERLTTRATIAQEAANQTVESPAMAGLKVGLTKMSGKGTGECTFELGKLLPTAGKAGMHSEAAMAMDMGGQKQAMSMKMDSNVQFEAK